MANIRYLTKKNPLRKNSNLKTSASFPKCQRKLFDNYSRSAGNILQYEWAGVVCLEVLQSHTLVCSLRFADFLRLCLSPPMQTPNTSTIHSDGVSNFSFASQANQALRHDGHFQGMDDEQSRDKLVTKYRQLYDQADLSSQKLEDDYQDQLSVLENHGGNLFLEVLEVGESEQ